MVEFKIGDRVRVKGRHDWPSPPGYKMAGAEGMVVKWVDYHEVIEEFRDYVHVMLEKVNDEGKLYTGSTFVFRAECLEKI